MKPEEAAKSRQQGVLALARLRISSDLETCTDSRRREQLTRALADIEAQIAEISATTKE